MYVEKELSNDTYTIIMICDIVKKSHILII